jgi:tetratricopeptide (TPR) repeat protein
MTHATVSLDSAGRIKWSCSDADTRDSRDLGKDDAGRFQDWATRYRTAIEEKHDAAALLAIGREMRTWLDGPEHWLERIADHIVAPLICAFQVPREPDEAAIAFLEAPWELLAGPDSHLALRADWSFCPVRRIGKAGQAKAPSEYRLAVLFMAAAPEGVTQLAYETEETAILDATGRIGLDLIVEESGSLQGLGECLARYDTPDVLHITCHGKHEPNPHLLLEDEQGRPVPVDPQQLAQQLNGCAPRLLFLSACQTAQADRVLGSMARRMVKVAAPAVLGWGASVRDAEATLFAASLYDRLAVRHLSLAEAVAGSRLALAALAPQKLEQESRDWHLARLYLGPTGGGALSSGTTARYGIQSDAASKAFLNVKDREVPVATEREFVGRRRSLQKALRELNATTDRRAGVLIHAVGRQGKSSLAARIAHRMPDHLPVVLHGRYDAASILDAIRHAFASPAVDRVVETHRDRIEDQPDCFETALAELLRGPCRQKEAASGDEPAHRPMLLVIDDFEQALEPEYDPPRVRQAYIESMRAVIRAFDTVDTRSALLLTSRHRFTLPHEGSELADKLFELPLPPMEGYERRKQANAKLRDHDAGKLDAAAPARIDRAIDLSQGNPGLQDHLFTLAITDAAKAQRCLDEMQRFLNGGEKPEEQALLEYLARLTIEALIDTLTDGQRELLRASMLLAMPAPLASFEHLARAAGMGGKDACRRLLDLSLWDRWLAADEDGHADDTDVAIDPMVRPYLEGLPEGDSAAAAGCLLDDLYGRWGGEAGHASRSRVRDLELTRLAVVAGRADILQVTAADAVIVLRDLGQYGPAASLGLASIGRVEAADLAPPIRLLSTTAEQCRTIGEVDETQRLLAAAVGRLGDVSDAKALPKGVDLLDAVGALLAHGRFLRQRGEVGAAETSFQRCADLLEGTPHQREAAVTLGEIARLRADKGEVDEAMALHEERLAVYEKLGDRRSRAVTLSEIARLKAARGEVDEAMASYEEMLSIFEKLGDRSARAVTLGEIARLKAGKGEVDEAMALHEEALAVYEKLGDRRSRAMTLGEIARLKAARGEVDEAMALHEEELAVYEKLGDRRSRAVTLGDIARLKAAKGEVDEAMASYEEMLSIFEKLGDRRSRAVTLGEIARLKAARGEVDEAMASYEEMLSIFEKLGDRRSRAVTLGEIARLKAARGEVDEAMASYEEMLSIFEKLGDRRSRAVTLGEIARLKAAKGEVDEAMALHEEQLAINEQLGDVDGQANAHWSIARIEAHRQQYQAAADHLTKAYGMLMQIGRLDGIAAVGVDLGQLLCAFGHRKEGLEILRRSEAGFGKLGQEGLAAQVRQRIAQIEARTES